MIIGMAKEGPKHPLNYRGAPAIKLCVMMVALGVGPTGANTRVPAGLASARQPKTTSARRPSCRLVRVVGDQPELDAGLSDPISGPTFHRALDPNCQD